MTSQRQEEDKGDRDNGWKVQGGRFTSFTQTGWGGRRRGSGTCGDCGKASRNVGLLGAILGKQVTGAVGIEVEEMKELKTTRRMKKCSNY